MQRLDIARSGDRFDFTTGLVESLITRGRSDDVKVTEVRSFGGSAFKVPKNAKAIIKFGKGSISRETKRAPGITPDAPTISIDGWCQGATLNVKNGRFAVFGEAAMFSAQVAGPNKRPMGMNSPDAKQNYQLLLNVMHWLTKVDGLSE